MSEYMSALDAVVVEEVKMAVKDTRATDMNIVAFVLKILKIGLKVIKSF